MAKKEDEKKIRIQENKEKETAGKQDLQKINEEAGWRKVVSNVNLRQGEYKGKKDINRMR